MRDTTTGSAKYIFFWKMLKKTIEYFLKFLFLFQSTILPVNNFNNFIQRAASAGQAVADHVVQFLSTLLIVCSFTNIVVLVNNGK